MTANSLAVAKLNVKFAKYDIFNRFNEVIFSQETITAYADEKRRKATLMLGCLFPGSTPVQGQPAREMIVMYMLNMDKLHIDIKDYKAGKTTSSYKGEIKLM